MTFKRSGVGGMKRKLLESVLLSGALLFASFANASLIVEQNSAITGNPWGIQVTGGTNSLQLTILSSDINGIPWSLTATSQSGDPLLTVNGSETSQLLSGVMNEFIYFILNVGGSSASSPYVLNPVGSTSGPVTVSNTGSLETPSTDLVSVTGSNASVVPEPSTLALITLGVLALFLGWRKHNKAS